ncbi:MULTISPECIES: carbamoyltransferase HypF [Marinovum]|uniref:carbamoyltransferase HypF n=1 Tax=Marinovum TaxID=367771 RepID=UPI00237A5C44|nr:carbamoyltransferase HypF [Marinovum sp. PR37]MDD9746180.1 carbamoyltransferase HypF [Marinovum sp. PR37]
MRDAPGAERITVRGLVQGVGFRPFVYLIAGKAGITGSVRNTGAGVEIDAFGTGAALTDFRNRLTGDAPPLARIDAIDAAPLGAPAPRDFSIELSTGGAVHAAATPDAALCDACRAELLDPGDRRHGYVFLNCTHCGPRFSILRALPYDRANTTMARFPMCPACRAEYRDVADRRFHAQPTACPECGPMLWAEHAGDATQREIGAGAIARAAECLSRGGIVALKGIGGFHLACDATDRSAIHLLRTRKRRPDKPFALMVRDLAATQAFVRVNDAEAAALASPAAPIVLLDMLPGGPLPEGLAPGLNRLGIMLPYSPLHAMLMEAVDVPLVMTSGNPGGDPQVTTNAEARDRLADFADLFLMHDRDIANRVDDSLVQVTAGRARPLRRGRGLAPRPLPLPEGFGASHPQVIAFGGDIKNTFGLAKGGVAVLSQHIGDLSGLATEADFLRTLELFETLYGLSPAVIAADPHPGYRSRSLARDLASARGLPLVEVGHHHAHAAACMVEHGVPLDTAPVLAVVQDGIGIGEAGALWGCEVLHCDYRGAKRLATLRTAPLPGGDQAARQPWRNLLARLSQAGTRDSWPASLCERLRGQPTEPLIAAMASGLNTPASSSAGRLFDAVAAAAGLCVARQTYEGEAAMRLQAAAEGWLTRNVADPYHFEIVDRPDMIEVDPAPIWPRIAADLAQEEAPGAMAARFHAGWARIWAEVVTRLSTDTGCDTIFLSGGVFQNRLLSAMLAERLDGAGLTVRQHAEVPANDGGLALGQIAVALARYQTENMGG